MNSGPLLEVTCPGTVIGEHVEDEQDGRVFGGTMDSGQNEDTLFCESVNDHQDRITTRRGWKGFNEVHRD